MRVLIVDDSPAFRAQTRRALESMSDLEVVGGASNGRLALAMVEQRAVDLIILDLNMPEMDGLEFLEKLAVSPRADLPVIVFSGRSDASATETLRALALGAKDFVVKPSGIGLSFETAHEAIRTELAPKIAALRSTSRSAGSRPVATAAPRLPNRWPRRSVEGFRPEAIVIASSTGGPAALETLFRALQGRLRAPVLIAQHMPATFTRFLGQRLGEIAGVSCREAVDGERILPGTAYVAPGDFHMRVASRAGFAHVELDQTPKLYAVRPAADHLFRTASDVYGEHLLGFVLTGMGEDGARGAETIKAAGGAVVIQDRASSVVWGMPAAVEARGAFDACLPLNGCADLFAAAANRQRGAA